MSWDKLGLSLLGMILLFVAAETGAISGGLAWGIVGIVGVYITGHTVASVIQ